MNGFRLVTDEDKLRTDAGFRKTVLKSLKYFVDTEIDKDKIIKPLNGAPHTHGTENNYRIDRQATVIPGLPTRWRIAIQINDGAPDPALHKVTRSKGKGGSSFSNSTATVAQIEVETAGFVFSSATPDILREAFYQSMIPEVLHKQVWLHTVVVHNDGTIFVKPNALYLQAVVAEQANRNKAPPTPGRGKKAQAKGKGFK